MFQLHFQINFAIIYITHFHYHARGVRKHFAKKHGILMALPNPWIGKIKQDISIKKGKTCNFLFKGTSSGSLSSSLASSSSSLGIKSWHDMTINLFMIWQSWTNTISLAKRHLQLRLIEVLVELLELPAPIKGFMHTYTV